MKKRNKIQDQIRATVSRSLNKLKLFIHLNKILSCWLNKTFGRIR